MKSWLGIAFYTVLVVFSSLGNAAELADVIDGLRPSVVGIGTVRPVRGSHKPAIDFRGTGFVVGNGRQVITNYHVLPEKLDRENKESLAIFVGRGKSGRAMVVKVLRKDRDHDLALLEIIDGSLPAMRLGDAAFIREGSDIAFTGFPIGMVLGLYPVTHKGIISAITPIVIPSASSRSITAAQMKRMRNPFDVYQLDATAYPGNSGSPVYDRHTGQVVGVINSVFVKGAKETVLEKPSGISYAIPVRYVHDLLKSR
ncbi:MAG: trypsin-like peptidase domain-containing protein [Gammaproteobacteria bacterium]|nr:trypsin-like peptidase domain-containing protein [Gammaproteobacteria bacterium]MBQ0839329.1 trypsin-like peptidase domain-containing protein [Gammaproteobacteria bacterium]